MVGDEEPVDGLTRLFMLSGWFTRRLISEVRTQGATNERAPSA